MLSIFPDFLTFGLLAPFILRMVVGFMFINFGMSEIKKTYKSSGKVQKYTAPLIKLVLAILLVIGLFTQFVAILLSIIVIGRIYKKTQNDDDGKYPIEFLLLTLAVLLSLVFLGAGFFAFDLPL